MPKPLKVRPLPCFKLWLSYDDGEEGEVDFSDLAGKGIFHAWDDRQFFETVKIAPHGAIAWGEQIELCPDAVYMRLTGKTPEDVFRSLNSAGVNA